MSTLMAFPWWLTLLAVVPIFWVIASLRERRRHKLLAILLGPQAPPERRTGATDWLRIFAIVAIVLGMAGPWWGRDPQAPRTRGRDILIVLDVSRSMLAEDRDGHARLVRARGYLKELADALRTRGGYRLGLIVFAGQAKLVCPFTEVFDHFLFALDRAHPDELGQAGRLSSDQEIGTNLQTALDLARTEIDAVEFQDCLLVTDGEDLSGGTPAITGMSVHVLGVGDPRVLRA